MSGFEAEPIAPLKYTAALPLGTVARAAYEQLRDDLLMRLRAAMPVDGVLLALHGAMVAEGYLDCEGDILQRVRALVGRACPIVSALDMHGNLSEAMLDAADALVAFDQNPHLDTFERGVEAANIMHRMVGGGLRTARALARPRLLLSALTTWTEKPPLSAVYERAKEMEQDARVVNVGVMGGFAYADTPFSGMCVTVPTDGDGAVAQRLANELCDVAWAYRDSARHAGVGIDEWNARASCWRAQQRRTGAAARSRMCNCSRRSRGRRRCSRSRAPFRSTSKRLVMRR